MAERTLRPGLVKAHEVTWLDSKPGALSAVTPSSSPLLGPGDLGACRAEQGGPVGIWHHLPPEQPPGFQGSSSEGFGEQLAGSRLVLRDWLASECPLGQVSEGCRRLALRNLSAVVLSDFSSTEATCSSSPTFCFLPRRQEHLKCYVYLFIAPNIEN